jgi:hypothetical protein
MKTIEEARQGEKKVNVSSSTTLKFMGPMTCFSFYFCSYKMFSADDPTTSLVQERTLLFETDKFQNINLLFQQEIF